MNDIFKFVRFRPISRLIAYRTGKVSGSAGGRAWPSGNWFPAKAG